MSVLKKRTVSNTVDVECPPATGTEFSERWPCLFEMLTSTRYPDGAARRTASLTLFYEDGLGKCCINDRDNEAVGFTSGLDVIQALDTMDAALKADKLEWRAAGGGYKKRQKKS